MAKPISIAIDGPAGAGKSTIARRLAKELGFYYVDTGAIYRTVAYFFDLWGVSPKDIDGITRYIDELTIGIEYDDEGVQHMIMNGMDVTGDIRTPELSQKASLVSAHAIVRDFFQRDGVDMGPQFQDCGLLLYDRKHQDMHAGASGCGCSASVLNGYLLRKMREGKWKTILFAPTGALLSPTSSGQGESIPSICHAVRLSAVRE